MASGCSPGAGGGACRRSRRAILWGRSPVPVDIRSKSVDDAEVDVDGGGGGVPGPGGNISGLPPRVESRPGALWARFPTCLSPESGPVLLSKTPLRRTGAMTLFSFTQCNEDVFSLNS